MMMRKMEIKKILIKKLEGGKLYHIKIEDSRYDIDISLFSTIEPIIEER